jgi:lysozyme family protein
VTPHDFAKGFIFRWEDGNQTDPAKTHSMDTEDSGNWTGGQIGIGRLVGSQHGVTAAALAAARGVAPGSITVPVMRALTLDEAADIALTRFYKGPNLDRLAWNAATASIFDICWGAGPVQGIKLLQRLVDAPADDGVITPFGATERLYNALATEQPDTFLAGAWWAVRDAFYDLIIEQNPVKKKYAKGWDNRSDYFTPGNSEGWWKRFHAS